MRRTWDPRMRTQLLATLGGAGEAKLKPLVRDAMIALRHAEAA
ncbi:MAG: formate dehydrogenase subunit delta [Sulfuritalea sp.]|nr:formate dehydrogenase subunit delta [Sulfuritalea sp.]